MSEQPRQSLPSRPGEGRRVIVIGGGLVGAVAAMFLARRGNRVDVFERNADLRCRPDAAGRSINLTLCHRGFRALDRIGAGDRVRAISVPLYGRRIHDIDGATTWQPYGNRGEAIHSVSRNQLNRVLLDFAESEHRVRFTFRSRCVGVDTALPEAILEDRDTGERRRERADVLIAADGANSAVRTQLREAGRIEEDKVFLDREYTELRMPPTTEGEWALEKNALHIWPRNRYMLINFPNPDGSFTCALHLPIDGEPSLASIKSEGDLEELFAASFPSARPLMPAAADEFFRHPTSAMVTLRSFPWAFDGRTVLLGDAAHAIYPSYGQGANSGFEDCRILDELLDRHGDAWPAALDEFQKRRKPDAEAIADLSIAHFAELQDFLGDARFLLRKRIERRAEEVCPDSYMPLYSMVSFTDIPYSEAVAHDRRQRTVIDRFVDSEGIEEELAGGEIDRDLKEALGTASLSTKALESTEHNRIQATRESK